MENMRVFYGKLTQAARLHDLKHPRLTYLAQKRKQDLLSSFNDGKNQVTLISLNEPVRWKAKLQ